MKIKLIKTAIALLALIGTFTIFPTTAAFAGNASTDICDTNAPEEIKKASGCQGATSTDISSTIQNIINSILAVLGIVAVIYIIVGGINYMTSAGDAGKAKKARDTILYAAIGLVVCGLSAAIANFVINAINNS